MYAIVLFNPLRVTKLLRGFVPKKDDAENPER